MESHAHASLNPYAYFQREHTLEEVQTPDWWSSRLRACIVVPGMQAPLR
jgi:hypothetical protein